MKRCAWCQGKLRLGVCYRNLWNSRWWVHPILFRSVHGAIQVPRLGEAMSSGSRALDDYWWQTYLPAKQG
jgi:hypothetical protein